MPSPPPLWDSRWSGLDSAGRNRKPSNVSGDRCSPISARCATTLNEIASSVAREPGLFDAAAADPVGTGARILFDRSDQALEGRTPAVFAVSAYRPSGSGTPLAWSGRPSEIPPNASAKPRPSSCRRARLGSAWCKCGRSPTPRQGIASA